MRCQCALGSHRRERAGSIKAREKWREGNLLPPWCDRHWLRVGVKEHSDSDPRSRFLRGVAQPFFLFFLVLLSDIFSFLFFLPSFLFYPHPHPHTLPPVEHVHADVTGGRGGGIEVGAILLNSTTTTPPDPLSVTLTAYEHTSSHTILHPTPQREREREKLHIQHRVKPSLSLSQPRGPP